MSNRVLVLVRKGGFETIPQVVWSHEVSILEAIHGEGTVEVVRDKTKLDSDGFVLKTDDYPQDMIPHLNPSNEWSRLQTYYGRHPEMPVFWCEFVYGRFNEGKFHKAIGAKQSANDVSGAEEMDGQALRAALDDMGTKYDPSSTVAELRKIYQKAA